MYSNNSVWKRILCLITMLALVLAFGACEDRDGTKPTSSTTMPVVQQTTTAPTIPTTAPTRPTVPPKPMSYELEFVLTQADVDEFYQYLEECEDLALNNASADDVQYAMEKTIVSLKYIYAQNSIAAVLHYSRTEDEALAQQYLDVNKTASDARDACVKMCRRLYQSEFAAKQAFFEDWTETDITALLAYNEQVAALELRNNEILTEYHSVDDDERFIELYIEFVQNNNAIAGLYGYDNYYEYAYKMDYGRDYSASSVALLRRYATSYLGRILSTAIDNYNDSIDNLNPWMLYRVDDLLMEKYNTLDKDYVGAYIDAMPENFATAMQTMLDRDSLFATAPDATDGAFTIDLINRPYCYFGPDIATCNTILHEGGHYYAACYTPLDDIPLDLAELHSQGNEWLFTQFLKTQLSAAEYQAVVDYKLYEDIFMIFVCLAVDAFEEQVYTTDISNFTAKDFDAMMDNVLDLMNFTADVDMHSYWRIVVMEQPVYYISYAVSGIGALSLFIEAQEDWDGAVDIYRTLCEDYDEEAGFLGNLEAVGLETPFDRTFYISLKNLVESHP